MKKIIFIAVLALFGVGCFQSCKCTTDTQEKSNDTLKVDSTLVVEQTISTDREQMFLEFNKDYRWFETCIVLKDYLDSEETDGTVVGVSNVFQYLVEKDGGYDTQVVLFAHVPDSSAVETKHGFWVEDFPLNDEEIKLTFREAYDRVMATNSPKPHSRQVVLRKQVGPKAANPQYIFGNTKSQLYVDAVTGVVTDKNPVFDANFAKPLGEWP